MSTPASKLTQFEPKMKISQNSSTTEKALNNLADKVIYNVFLGWTNIPGLEIGSLNLILDDLSGNIIGPLADEFNKEFGGKAFWLIVQLCKAAYAIETATGTCDKQAALTFVYSMLEFIKTNNPSFIPKMTEEMPSSFDPKFYRFTAPYHCYNSYDLNRQLLTSDSSLNDHSNKPKVEKKGDHEIQQLKGNGKNKHKPALDPRRHIDTWMLFCVKDEQAFFNQEDLIGVHQFYLKNYEKNPERHRLFENDAMQFQKYFSQIPTLFERIRKKVVEALASDVVTKMICESFKNEKYCNNKGLKANFITLASELSKEHQWTNAQFISVLHRSLKFMALKDGVKIPELLTDCESLDNVSKFPFLAIHLVQNARILVHDPQLSAHLLFLSLEMLENFAVGTSKGAVFKMQIPSKLRENLKEKAYLTLGQLLILNNKPGSIVINDPDWESRKKMADVKYKEFLEKKRLEKKKEAEVVSARSIASDSSVSTLPLVTNNGEATVSTSSTLTTSNQTEVTNLIFSNLVAPSSQASALNHIQISDVLSNQKQEKPNPFQ